MPMLEGASNFTISGFARLYDIRGDAVINQITDTKELKRFQSFVNVPRAHAGRADYQTGKKSGPCFEGTREALLQETDCWFDSPGESRMYVLSGIAGIGKSTVAYTVATRADDHGQLGASFFFSRDTVDCSNAKKFFNTLAYQLGLYNEEFAQAIADALVTKRGSTATTASPLEQLVALILEPLRGVATSSDRSILLVVDALDECDDEDIPSVLEGLRRIVQDLPSFKIILTTRPQPLIINDFAFLDGHKLFHLQDIEDKVVNDDIRLYLKHSLSWEQVKARLPGLRKKWYASDTEIESLVRVAGKLFIIASTAVLFILDKAARDPKRRMGKLLDAFAQDRAYFKVLNDFYSVILRNAVPEDCDDDIVEHYQSIVGAIVVLQIPLSITALACLIGIEEEAIQAALDNLQSVILIDDYHVPYIYHKSFLDYITDSEGCKDVNLRINPTDHHTRIVTRCFETMNTSLKYNILGLDGPARFMDNEKGIAHQGISDEKLQEKITPTLRYAGIYWANHIESAKFEDDGLMKELENFAYNHLLHWFEALILIRKLDSAHHSIRVALRLVQTASSDLFQLLSDGLRFISKFYEVIKQSALHIYYSALPFTPTESVLYRRYKNEAMNGICQVIGGPKKWDALVATPNHGNKATQIKFSIDSTMFASLDDYGRVKVWDATTGTPFSTFSLSSDGVANSDDMPTAVAIANDFSTVASARNNIITLYSVTSGAHVATVTAPSCIWGMALSFESSRVAAWLSDGMVCLWSSGNGELITSFGGFDTRAATLVFSRAGTSLVCAPLHGDCIQLRNGITGALITNVATIEEAQYGHHVVFSHDSSRFAVSTNEAVTVWESKSGELVGAVVNMDNDSEEPDRLAISTNGSLLAIRGNAQTQLWSADSGNSLILIDVLIDEPDAESVPSHKRHFLAFSPGDILAIGTDSKITIYDVKNRSVISALPFLTRGLAFSPDCTRLVAVSAGGTIHLWDVQSLNSSSTKLENRVVKLASSQDHTRLAFQMKNGAINLYDTITKRMTPIHHGQNYGEKAVSFGFSPDGRTLATWSAVGGAVRVWNSGDATSIGSVRCSSGVNGVALSNGSMLAVGYRRIIALWDFRKQHIIDIVRLSGKLEPLFFSNSEDHLVFRTGLPYDNDGDLYTWIIRERRSARYYGCRSTTFSEIALSADDSHLMSIGFPDICLDLPDRETTAEGRTFNQLVQLGHFPLWSGILVRVVGSTELGELGDCLMGLFSQYEDPVPVVWIPSVLRIVTSTHRSFMITLACDDGPIIFVPSSSNAFDSLSLLF